MFFILLRDLFFYLLSFSNLLFTCIYLYFHAFFFLFLCPNFSP
jgi:hypothetical protein